MLIADLLFDALSASLTVALRGRKRIVLVFVFVRLSGERVPSSGSFVITIFVCYVCSLIYWSCPDGSAGDPFQTER